MSDDILHEYSAEVLDETAASNFNDQGDEHLRLHPSDISVEFEVSPSSHTRFQPVADSDNDDASSVVLAESSLTTTNIKQPEHSKLSSDAGPLSPFALRSSRTENNLIPWTNAKENQPLLSLVPCRKVSSIVCVTSPPPADEQLCLFPLINDSDKQTTLYEKPETKELVLVNPTAFGKKIPAKVTMETARLVAQVAHVESEDWARLYKVDQVLWPQSTQMNKLAQAMANDALRKKAPCVCFGLGSNDKCRSTLLGSIVIPRQRVNVANDNVSEKYGLLGTTLEHLWQQDRVVCTLSLLEIIDEDAIRDLLATQYDPYLSKTPTPLRIRHPDHGGAVVYNLSELPVDSLSGLEKLLCKAFHSNSSIRARRREGSRGHVVATVKVWQNSTTSEPSNDNTDCTILGFVDLNSGESNEACKSNDLYSEKKRQSRRVTSIRKSLSGLRGVLRGLLLQDHANPSDAPTPIPYRECTLTKVLQRVLSQPDSRAVVISTVCPRSESYQQTLQTLSYSNRLLIRPGDTARSPFASNRKPSSTYASPTLDQFTDDALLKSVLSDPRQRLAKLITMSPKRPSPDISLENVLLDDEYVPNDYMSIDSRIMDKILSGPSKSRETHKDGDNNGITPVKRALWSESGTEDHTTTEQNNDEWDGTEDLNLSSGAVGRDANGADPSIVEDAPQARRDTELVPSVTPVDVSHGVPSDGETPEPLLNGNVRIVKDKKPDSIHQILSESDESALSPDEANKRFVQNAPPGLPTNYGGESGNVLPRSATKQNGTNGKKISHLGRSSSDSTPQQPFPVTYDSPNDGAAPHYKSFPMQTVPKGSRPSGGAVQETIGQLDDKKDMEQDVAVAHGREWDGDIHEVKAKTLTRKSRYSRTSEITKGVKRRIDYIMESFGSEDSDEFPMKLSKDEQEAGGDIGQVLKSPLMDSLQRPRQNDEPFPSMSETDDSQLDESDFDGGESTEARTKSVSVSLDAIPFSYNEAFSGERFLADGGPHEEIEDKLEPKRSTQDPSRVDWSPEKATTEKGHFINNMDENERLNVSSEIPATQLRKSISNENLQQDLGMLRADRAPTNIFPGITNNSERQATKGGQLESVRSVQSSLWKERSSSVSAGEKIHPSERDEDDQWHYASNGESAAEQKETVENQTTQGGRVRLSAEDIPKGEKFSKDHEPQSTKGGGLESGRSASGTLNLERSSGEPYQEEMHLDMRSEDAQKQVGSSFEVMQLRQSVKNENAQESNETKNARDMSFRKNSSPFMESRLEAERKATGDLQVDRSSVDDSHNEETHVYFRNADDHKVPNFTYGSAAQHRKPVDKYAFKQDRMSSAASDFKWYNENARAKVNKENHTATVFDMPHELESEIRRFSNETELDLRDETIAAQELDPHREYISETTRSSSEIIDEISVLETVVDEVKRMHNGLYESSAHSLERLRESYLSNQYVLRKAVSARIKAEKDAEATSNQLARQRQQHTDAILRYEQEVSHLEKRLNQAIGDRLAIEKIAEDAIAAQDKLEKEISRLNEQMSKSQRENAELTTKYDNVLGSRDALSQKLEALTHSFSTMQSEKEQCEIIMLNLKETIRRVEFEKSQLVDAGVQDKEKLEELLQTSRFHAETKRELGLLKKEVSSLKIENDHLNTALDQRDRDVANAKKQESVLGEVRREATRLRSELQMSQRNFELEVSKTKDTIHSLREERSQLLTELSETKRTLRDASFSLSLAVQAKEAAAAQAAEERRARIEKEKERNQHDVELERLSAERENDKERIEQLQNLCEKLRNGTKAAEEKLKLEKERSSALLEKATEENRAHNHANIRLREIIERLRTERDSGRETMSALREETTSDNRIRSQAEADNSILQSRLEESEMTVERLREEVRQMKSSMSRTEAEGSLSKTESEAFSLRKLEAERENGGVLVSKLKEELREANETKRPSGSSGAAELQRENEIRKSLVAPLSQRLDQYDVARESVSLESFRIEQTRRRQAEELTASLAAQVKAGLDMRNQEILSLRRHLSEVMDEKESEIYRLRTKLHAMEKYHATEWPSDNRSERSSM